MVLTSLRNYHTDFQLFSDCSILEKVKLWRLSKNIIWEISEKGNKQLFSTHVTHMPGGICNPAHTVLVSIRLSTFTLLHAWMYLNRVEQFAKLLRHWLHNRNNSV